MKISEILLKYNTDKNKGSLRMGPGTGHFYGETYDRIFEEFDKDSEVCVIEIGVEKGGSLLAWKEYFKNGFIVGIDISDNRIDEYKSDEVYYILSDIKDPSLKDNSLIKNNQFDIIIDDGSHYFNDVFYLISNYLDKLKINGYLIVEDCQQPEMWLSNISPIITNDYIITTQDLRNINGNYDDYLIIIKKIR
jgi:cephalosporin hydroxylase